MVLILIDWPCWLRVNLSGHHVNMVFSGGPGSGVISPLGRAICAARRIGLEAKDVDFTLINQQNRSNQINTVKDMVY